MYTCKCLYSDPFLYRIRLKWNGHFHNSTRRGRRVTHICVNKLTIIGSDNGLSPDQHQANNWTNAGISLIEPLGTNFSEILIEIETFSLKKIRSKMSSAIFRLGLNVLNWNVAELHPRKMTRASSLFHVVHMHQPSRDSHDIDYR